MRITSSGQQAVNLVFDFLFEDSNRKHCILQAPSFFGAIRSAKEWKTKGIQCSQFESVPKVEKIVKSNPKGTKYKAPYDFSCRSAEMAPIQPHPFSLINCNYYTGSCVVYLTSNFAQPSGYSLSINDKQSLAQLAKDYDCIIVEDNPYDLIHFGNFKYVIKHI